MDQPNSKSSAPVTQTVPPDHSEAEHTQHVNPWLVFGILAAMTVLEVALSLLQLSKGILTPLLISMSLVKAGLVALYYMHLRYEKLIYALVFITPTLAGLLLISILLSP